MQTEKEYITERAVLGVHSESVGEYPLPDYNGDVKRVLMISPRVCPTGKYMNESSIEFSGCVFYDVIYLDSENNLARAEFSTDYELALKQDPESYEECDAHTSVTSYNVRLIGPRKFSAKASLSSDVRIKERRSLDISGDALTEGDAEILSKDAELLTPVILNGQTSELREELAFIDGAIEDEINILTCDVSMGVPEMLYGEGSCDIKCTLTVKLVYKNADEAIAVRTVEMPYSARIESEEPEGCTSLFGRVDVSSLTTELLPTDDGVGIAALLAVTPTVRGVKNERMEIVLDAYLKDKGTSNEYRDFVYNEHVCSGSAEKSFCGRIPLSEVTDANVEEIISCDCVVSQDSIEVIDDGVLIGGELRFNALAREKTENGDNYVNLRFALPFEQNVNINCQIHDNMHPEAAIWVYGENAEIADGHINAGCNIYSCVSVSAQRKMRCLGASYLTDEEYEKEESVLTVYYPDDREGVFEIAKKFHTSVRKISEDNALTESVFNAKDTPIRALGCKKLLIR